MSSDLETLIAKMHSVGDDYCENQMYVWPGFSHANDDPEKFFAQQGIEFDGILHIRYPVSKTFDPVPADQLAHEEHSLGATLPDDYKLLLQEFGQFHLPGKASIILESPAEAVKTTRNGWCYKGQSLSVLAISPYNQTSDGNSIGFIRTGDSFSPTLYELDHELRCKGDNPSLWTKKVGDSLTAFLLGYLDRHIAQQTKR